jgi:hypothetical protein
MNVTLPVVFIFKLIDENKTIIENAADHTDNYNQIK